ncbi:MULTISPECIES: VirE2 family protein [unclassified Mesorhizobium]|uniref:VirE2 family protein n=2 Tax=Mesorhizobium TaxID=68287 RepID=UPI001FDF4C99|nr:VirE2 family protein [Mesorhizobium sp. M7A.F.Ca.MR.176.00.0.0]
MDREVKMEVDSERVDVSARRLEKLNLAARRPRKAASLPSDESMMIGIQDIKLKESGMFVVPVDSKATKDDPKKNAYTFFKGTEFQALKGLGNKTSKEIDNELVYIRYNDNYYTKNGLWHAIKAPDGQQTTKDYKDYEFRRITTSLGLTAERDNDLYETGKGVKKDRDGRTVFKDGKPEKVTVYNLEGERQIYKTPAGDRRRGVAHKNPYTSGEQAPDILHRSPDGKMKGFSRLPNDDYQKSTARELETALGGKIWLKSKLHGYQTIDYIERTLGEKQATHRLRDYVGEERGYNRDTHSAYVKIGTKYFPINEVLENLPTDPAAMAVKENPSMDAMEHRMIIRMPEGNTFAGPGFVAGLYSEYFKDVCDKHGINPEWGKFKPDWDKMLDKYASDSRVLVEVDGALVEGNSVELPDGESILDIYAAERIFYADDAKTDRGGIYTKPSFTSLAQTLQRADQQKNEGKQLNVPDSVTEILLRSRGPGLGEVIDVASPQLPPGSRYDDRIRDAVNSR